MINMKIREAAGWLLHRQRLINPVQCPAEYDELFRAMAPVPTPNWCAPGTAPKLAHRAAFDDQAYTYGLRAQRIIVKGRFQRGNIGYIFADQWPLFAALYRKPLAAMSPRQKLLWTCLEQEGPLSVGQLREVTGLPAKEITPALHRMQQAFLVFEDQADGEGDRSWFRFESEFPDTDLATYNQEQALAMVLPELIALNGFLDSGGLADVLALPERIVRTAADRLTDRGVLRAACLEGVSGYVAAKDAGRTAPRAETSVFALDRNDFCVRCHSRELKKRMTPAQGDTLYYLLIDGRFAGIVTGRFRNGPFEAWDVQLQLGADEAKARQEEILQAVAQVLDPAVSPLRRYQGRVL